MASERRMSLPGSVSTAGALFRFSQICIEIQMEIHIQIHIQNHIQRHIQNHIQNHIQIYILRQAQIQVKIQIQERYVKQASLELSLVQKMEREYISAKTASCYGDNCLQSSGGRQQYFCNADSGGGDTLNMRRLSKQISFPQKYTKNTH